MKWRKILPFILILAVAVTLAAFQHDREVDSETMIQPADNLQNLNMVPQLEELGSGRMHYAKSKDADASLAEVMGDVFDPMRDEYLEGIDVDLFLADGTPHDTTTTVVDGKFSFADLDLGDYHIVIDLPNYRPLNLYFTIDGDALHQLPPAWMVPEPIIEEGDAAGMVINVLTGVSINDVALEFKEGIDPPDADPVVLSTTTQQAGFAKFEYQAISLPAGVYTVYASKSGFRPDKFHIYVLGGKEVKPQNGILSPQLTGDAFRIVLTWGFSPADLDSHLWAPNPFGNGKVHLYYPYSSTWGTNPWAAYFNLDLDDTMSFGPETTTILQWEAETYCFYVHNFAEMFGNSQRMSNSNARVAIITATDTTFFYITPNTPGTEWGVFTIDGVTREITPLNTYAPITDENYIGIACDLM